MDLFGLLRRVAGFMRQDYPQNAPAVGHCPLVALMPCTVQTGRPQDRQK